MKQEKNILNYCNACKFLTDNFSVEYWCTKFEQFLDYEKEKDIRYIIPLKNCKDGPFIYKLNKKK